MKSSHRNVFCALLTAACMAALAADPVDADRELWKSVKHVEQKHLLTPGGWRTVTEKRWGASFSAPCEFKRDEIQQGAVTAVQFRCESDGRVYIAVVVPMGSPADQDTKASMFERFSLSNDAAMLSRMKEMGIDAKLTPKMWVKFGGLTGRQHTISTPGFDIETRTLQGPNSAVTMAVRDTPGNFPGDVATYFNTAKLE